MSPVEGENRSDRRGRVLGPRAEVAAHEEIEHHLAELTERLVNQGYPAKQARLEAERRFGNVRVVKSILETEIRSRHRKWRSRDLVQAVARDARHAGRSIRRALGFSATVVLTLSVGIGGALAVGQMVDAVLLRPLAVADAASLVGVFQAMGRRTVHSDGSVTETTNRYERFAYPNYIDLREGSETADLAAAHTMSAGLRAGDRALLGTVAAVSGNFFNVLGLAPAEGRLLLPSDETDASSDPVLVLSDRAKRRLFGRADAIGSTLQVNGEGFLVVGTAPRGFRGTSLDDDVDAWIPVQRVVSIGAGGLFSLPDVLETRAMTWLSVIARRRPGVSPEMVQSELNHLLNGLRSQYEDVIISDHISDPVTVTPIAEAALVQGREQMVRFLGLLLGIVAATFIVACANVANLFVTRGAYRRREFTILRALGASRARLASLVLFEGMILTVVGTAVGIVVAQVISRLISSFALPGNVALRTLDLGIDLRLIGAGFGVGVFASLLFTLPPVLTTSRNEYLRSGRAVASAGPFSTLVALQLALSLTLLAGAFLFTQSVRRSIQVDLGFDVRNVAAISAGLRQHGIRAADAGSVIDDVLRVVESDPRVSSVAMAAHVPLAPARLNMPITSEQGAKHTMGVNIVAGRFFETLRIPIVAGVSLEEHDRRSEPVAVVNESAAHVLWPDQAPIGRRFQLIGGIGDFFTVVGVVSTISNHSVTDEGLPYVYVSARQKPDLQFLEEMSVLARASSDVLAVSQVLRDALVDRLPGLPVFDSRVVQDQIDQVLMPQRFGQRLLGILGTIAVSVSAIGVYGLVTFALSQQRRELGIRRALGARWNHLVLTVCSRILRAGIAGLFAGVVLLLLVSPWISRFLLLVGPRDPLAIVGAAVLLTTVCVLATLPGARRASSVDPRVTLEET